MSGFRPLRKGKPAKTKSSGYLFDSRFESNLHMWLCDKQEKGEIRELKVKPNVLLTRAKIRMIPDFSAVDAKTNETVYHEAKGFETDIWRIKRRLWEHYGPGKLIVYKGSGTRFGVYEEIIPTNITPPDEVLP